MDYILINMNIFKVDININISYFMIFFNIGSKARLEFKLTTVGEVVYYAHVNTFVNKKKVCIKK